MIMTMGDINGVGPEIIVKLLSNGSQSLPLKQFPVVFGLMMALKKASIELDLPVNLQLIKSLEEWSSYPDKICVFEAGVSDFELNPGKIDPISGSASLKWVHDAVLCLKSGQALGMVTAPVSKEAIEPNSPGFQGHTEYIGEMCHDPEPVLALVHEDWIVAHVSTHVSLRVACDRVQKPRIKKTVRLLDKLLGKLKPGCARKIGVAGLNPHAGENGLFGQEEIEVIRPVIEELNAQNMNIVGPIPADVVFPQLRARMYDGVVAMYHDQGHVVTKTIAFDLGQAKSLRGVNITLGLDVIRTSVDHGTGFDVAWTGVASCESLNDALILAHRVAQ